MVGPVGGGGFAPMGGFSPLSSGSPAGGAACPAGAEGVGGVQGPEGLNTTAGKAHGGESGFDALSAVEAANASTGAQKQAEDVVAQMVNALQQLLKQHQQPSGQDASGADAVGGVSGAKANAAKNDGAQNPNDPPKSIADIFKERPTTCQACMGLPGPHSH